MFMGHIKAGRRLWPAGRTLPRPVIDPKRFWILVEQKNMGLLPLFLVDPFLLIFYLRRPHSS